LSPVRREQLRQTLRASWLPALTARQAARRFLVSCYRRTGDKAKARTEFFGVLLPSSPPQQQESLRLWFERQMP